MSNWVVMVHGIAGVGKTSFGKRLAKELDKPFIDIPEYVKERRLHRGYDRLTRAYLIDLRAVSAGVGAELRGTGGVVSSIFPFKPRGLNVKVAVVLRMRPDKLMKILTSRGYPAWKIAENISAELVDQPLYSALKRYGSKKVVQLDLTERQAESVAAEFARALKERRFKELHVDVDWATELEKVGELDKILGFLSRHG